MATEPSKTKPGLVRQVITLLVALGLFAAAAFVVLPKLQRTTTGPVRVDVVNNTQASMLELTIDLRMPENALAGSIPGTIAAGDVATVYEGMGPITVESIGYVAGADGSMRTQTINLPLDPGKAVTLGVASDGVEVRVSEIASASP